MPDVALLIDWENVYYTLRQHTTGPLPSTLAILQAILKKAAEFGPVRVKLAIFGQEVAAQDDTLLMALEFTGMEPLAVAQRMSGRVLKGRSDAVLITRAMKLLYKERPDIQVWFIVSGDRDLNALCKALKDEDKNVYLVAGDLSLANELRDSPYLRDEVFLLEDLIPEARWTRTGQLRTDDTQADKVVRPAVPSGPAGAMRRPRGGRGRVARPAAPPLVPAVVPTASPESEKEQRRLAVLLLDQLVALRADSMARGDFVRSVVPLSEKEASSVLEQRVDAAIEQGHVTATMPARTRARVRQMLAPSFASSMVAETFFHLVRVLRRIDTVTSRDTRRVPAVEAVLDPLSRADQPGGLAKGRTARRVLLETLFNIAEERGAIATEQVTREDRQITMCWLQEGHPLVAYARQPAAAIVHLFNFVSTAKTDPDLPDWVNNALFSELLARVEGERLEASLRAAAERQLIRLEERGRKAGYVIDKGHLEARALLGGFALLNGQEPALAAEPARAEARGRGAGVPVSPDTADAAADRAATPVGAAVDGAETDPHAPPGGAALLGAETDPQAAPGGSAGSDAPTAEVVPVRRTRRGTRGGRGRRGGGRARGTVAGGGEAAAGY